MSVAPKRGNELFVLRDGKPDDSIHDRIIDAGDDHAALAIGVRVAREAGLDDDAVALLYGPAAALIKFNPHHDERGRFTSGGGSTILNNVTDALIWAQGAPVMDVIKAVVTSQPFIDGMMLAVASLVAYGARNPDVAKYIHQFTLDNPITLGQASQALRSVITGLKNLNAMGLLMKAKDDKLAVQLDRIIAALDDFDESFMIKFNPYHDELGRFTTGGGSDSPGVVTGTPVSRNYAEAAASQVAEHMDFRGDKLKISDESLTFMLNDKQFFYAGSADLRTGQGTLYLPHLTKESVEGIAAHEIEHLKFQEVLQAYYKEYSVLRLDPGPPPDPNGQYHWQRRGGTDALMTPDGSLRSPYDKKYPIYTALHDAYHKPLTQEFSDSDGVSDYSAEYWKGWKDGKVNTDIAFHETLAEMARIRYTTGSFPKHRWTKPFEQGKMQQAKAELAAGTKRWQDLFKAVDSIYEQLGRKKL